MKNTQIIENNTALYPFVFFTQTMKDLFYKGKEFDDSAFRSILIMGEKGTGKELLAKSIHCNFSPNAPFFSINCSDLPFEYFQEKVDECFEMFSDEKISFLKPDDYRKPTLFLRDIGKLEADLQKSLLSLLKDRMIESSSRAVRSLKNLRLIFTFSKNGDDHRAKRKMENEIKKSFNPFLLSILPLRDRIKDIKPLAFLFMDKFCKEYGKNIGGIHSEALSSLNSHLWPGNVSELRDVMENAVLLSQSPLITIDDIRFNISKKSIALESFLSGEDFFKLGELENIYIKTVLRRVKNNKSKASKILGISRNTLQRKLDSFLTKPLRKKPKKKTGNQPALF